MSNTFVWINDEYIPVGRASLLVSDMSLQRGYGIFDFFKTVNSIPVFLDDHLNRFYHSAEHMRLPVGKNRDELKTIIQELIERNLIPYSGIRLTLTGGYSEDGYAVVKPNLVITQKLLPMFPKEAMPEGIRLVTYGHQREMPAIKTINYLMAIWLQPFIQQNGADDVLYHKDGIISECPRSNIFIVTSDDTIVTPSRNILKGITRMKALQLAGQKFKTEERDIPLEELRNAKEAFITSTTKHILPVLQCDQFMIGNGQPGMVSQWLNKELRNALQDQLFVRNAQAG